MIREATPVDIPAISALWEQMVREMRPGWTPRRDIWEEMCRTLMDQPFYTVLVAEGNGIVGFADGMIFIEPSTGQVHGVGQHFYVIPEQRGFVGGILYREIVSRALAGGAKVLEFFCFPEELSLWGRHGYQPARAMVRLNV